MFLFVLGKWFFDRLSTAYVSKGVSSFWKVGGDTERGREATELVQGEGVGGPPLPR